MKVKFTLIPFIPAALAMIIFRVMSIFGADDSGHFLGMDKMAVSYTAIGIAAVLFVACIIINIFDRKTSPVYPVKKNIAAGVLSALSGAMVIASSVATFMNSTTDSEYYVMSLISAIASIPAGIAFFLMTRIHLQGKTVVSGLSTLFVFPAIWGCTEIVYEFLEATKVSISATDMTPLFCFIFLSLYYFSHAMVLSRVKGRSPVKACFIYGLPAVALALSYSIYRLFTGIQEGGGYTSVLNAGMFFVLGAYAISFITEMAFNSLTKDELKVIDGLPDSDKASEEEKKYIAEKVSDRFNKYYNILGPERLKAAGYSTDILSREISDLLVSKDSIRERILSTFKVGEKYKKSDIKPRLQEIYTELGLSKTAKAIEINGFRKYGSVRSLN